MNGQANTPRTTGLTVTLASAFVVLSILPLLLVGGIDLARTIDALEESVASSQRILAMNAAKEVSAFIDRVPSILNSAAKIGRPISETPTQRKWVLENLFRLHPAIREVAIIDKAGMEISKLSNQYLIDNRDLGRRGDSAMFQQPPGRDFTKHAGDPKSNFHRTGK